MTYTPGDTFSRDGTGNSQQDIVGKAIYERATKLLLNRRLMLCRLKIEDPVHDVAAYALDEDKWNAWYLLQEDPQFVEKVITTSIITVKDTNRRATFFVPIGDVKVPDIDVHIENLPSYIAEPIWQWAVKDLSFQLEAEYIQDKIYTLCRMCATPGQLRRVWPELLNFMPDQEKDKLLAARARSPYPAGVKLPATALLESRAELFDGYVLKPGWTPLDLEWMNEVITQCLLLPPAGDGPFPSHYGVRENR